MAGGVDDPERAGQSAESDIPRHDRVDSAVGQRATGNSREETLQRLLTERVAVRAALSEAQERWRLVLETAHDAFIGMNEAGEIIDWNRRAEEIFGWSADQAIGRSLANMIVPPQLRAAHRRGLRHFLRTGEGPILFRRVEFPALHRDGHVFDAEVTIWPTRNGDEHRFNAFVRDVSARKRVEAHVRLLERVAVAANNATSVEQASQRALAEVCALTGWPVGHAYVTDPSNPDRLVPTAWWQLAGEEAFQTFHDVTERTPLQRGAGLPGRVLATGRPACAGDLERDTNFPRARVAADLGVRSGFAFPVLVGDEVVAVLEFYDIKPTEPDADLLAVMANVGTQLGRVFERERAARKLEQANRELRAAVEIKDRFLSIVSHELRSPLSAILGYAALMDASWDEFDEEDKRDYVRSIERQSRRLTRLVRDLLTVSRLDAEAVEVEPADVDLRGVIEQVIDDLGLDVSEIDCPPGVRVHADPDHIVQILVNFLSNADRHGAPPIRILVEPAPTFVDTRVCDAGPGIPEGFLPRLFQPFARARGVEPAGTGLGLSIVQRLARANGGDTWYESAKPHGACFVVRLPSQLGDLDSLWRGEAEHGGTGAGGNRLGR